MKKSIVRAFVMLIVCGGLMACEKNETSHSSIEPKSQETFSTTYAPDRHNRIDVVAEVLNSNNYLMGYVTNSNMNSTLMYNIIDTMYYYMWGEEIMLTQEHMMALNCQLPSGTSAPQINWNLSDEYIIDYLIEYFNVNINSTTFSSHCYDALGKLYYDFVINDLSIIDGYLMSSMSDLDKILVTTFYTHLYNLKLEIDFLHDTYNNALNNLRVSAEDCYNDFVSEIENITANAALDGVILGFSLGAMAFPSPITEAIGAAGIILASLKLTVNLIRDVYIAYRNYTNCLNQVDNVIYDPLITLRDEILTPRINKFTTFTNCLDYTCDVIYQNQL